MINLLLTAQEDGSEWTARGETVRKAMAGLRKELELATMEFPEEFLPIWEEATIALESGQSEFNHFDFSCPEEAFKIEIIN